MRNKLLVTLLFGMILTMLTGCTLSLLGTPAATPPQLVIPTLTPLIASPTPVISTGLPSDTPEPTKVPPTETVAVPTIASPSGVVTPGTSMGPYAVILVKSGDVLNIRSGPGTGKAVVGSLPITAISVMRTRASAKVGDDLWVEVQKPGGGTGWVNANFLTEYVTPAAFCGDAKVTTLINNLKTALQTSNGDLLASLVSPVHGMDVRLWRYGTAVNYDQAHAKWLFASTYKINWGPAPGSGLNTVGAFHVEVLPKLLDVFNASYELHCNDVGVAAPFALEPWPVEYANVNFFNIYKPGSAGVEFDWRTWLAGVEYVDGKPTLFSLIHFQWEP